MAIIPSLGQNVRYVQYNTIHALSVPPNPAYSFKWSMTWGATEKPININSTTNQTENIRWDRKSTQYNISVYPILDSVDCPGEPIYMTVFTVDYLSLHAFDDVYYIEPDQSFTGDVS